MKKRIISMLQEDGRLTITQIAENLGISHTGVKKHLDKLLGDDTVSIKALINTKKLCLKLVLILIETESYEASRNILSRFKKCPRIALLASLVGGYNIVALAVAENMDVLESITSVCALRTSKGIRRSEVYLVSDLVYPDYMLLKPLLISASQEKPPCGYNCCTCPRYLDGKCVGCPYSKCYRGVFFGKA